MQNSDLRSVLINAIQTADDRLLSMLYAVTKSYQITEAQPVPTPSTEAVAPVEVATERTYKDDRPRRVVRVYRKPKAAATPEQKVVTEVAPKVVRKVTPTVAKETAPVVRRVVAKPAVNADAVSGKSNNGTFINDLMGKTVTTA